MPQHEQPAPMFETSLAEMWRTGDFDAGSLWARIPRLPRAGTVLALCAGLVAGVGVAEQRVGLAVGLTGLLLIAAARSVHHQGARPPAAARAGTAVTWVLAVLLALVPLWRDCGWVVALSTVAALVGAAWAAQTERTWHILRRAVWGPLRFVGGATALLRTVAPTERAARPPGRVAAIARGVALGGVLLVVFGTLLAGADRRFADLLDDLATVDLSGSQLAERIALAVLVAASAAGLVRLAMTPTGTPTSRPATGRTELLIGVGALAALFALFVAVQLRVLFGGSNYVRATTGLGYGEYARQGFTQLVVTAVLTLVVIGWAARNRDPAVRAVLGLICLLTLVMVGSAAHRLALVIDAYGLTRTRVGGAAVLVWLALLFPLVIAAGMHAGVARRLPAVTVIASLVGVLALAAINPDGRIAADIVDRAHAHRTVDPDYVRGLSADALGALDRPDLPEVLAQPRHDLVNRLTRPDGVAGWNWTRWRARATKTRPLPVAALPSGGVYASQ